MEIPRRVLRWRWKIGLSRFSRQSLLRESLHGGGIVVEYCPHVHQPLSPVARLADWRVPPECVGARRVQIACGGRGQDGPQRTRVSAGASDDDARNRMGVQEGVVRAREEAARPRDAGRRARAAADGRRAAAGRRARERRVPRGDHERDRAGVHLRARARTLRRRPLPACGRPLAPRRAFALLHARGGYEGGDPRLREDRARDRRPARRPGRRRDGHPPREHRRPQGGGEDGGLADRRAARRHGDGQPRRRGGPGGDEAHRRPDQRRARQAPA